MKVLQVNVCYPYGSTGKICKDIHEELIKKGIESKVLYAYGKNYDDKNLIRIALPLVFKLQSLRSRLTGYAYSGCIYSTKKIIDFIHKEKPDIVHLQCVNGYIMNIYKVMDYLKNNNIKTVLTFHAEFMFTSGCAHSLNCDKWKTGCSSCNQLKGYRPHSWLFDRTYKEWHLMKNAYEKFDDITICCVSDWLKNRAMQSPFLTDKKVVTVGNGLDKTIFNNSYKTYEKKEVLSKYNLLDKEYFIHVTPNFNSSIKGGKYVLELASAMSDKLFVIVGYNGDCVLPPNVIAIPHTDNQKELAILYNVAKSTVLTSKQETFSMVTAESLCCGTPIVGFKAGGPESIALPNYSRFVDFANIHEFVKELLMFENLSLDKQMISSESIKKYKKEKMVENYLSIYRGVY